MAKQATLLSTWRLLKPYALPRLPLFVLVALLGSFVALSQTSSILLIDPLWKVVIFPSEEEATETSEVAEVAEATEAPGTLEAPGLPDMKEKLGLPDLRELFSQLQETGIQWTGIENDRVVALLVVVALLLLLGFLGGLAQFGFIWLLRWLSLGMVVDMRLDVARHMMGLSMRYHGQRHFGDLLSRVSSDVQTTLAAVDLALKNLIQEPAFVIALTGAAVLVAPQLTLYAIIAVPLLIMPIAIFSKKIRKGSTRSATTLGASVQALSEMFQGIRTVKSFRAEEREIERYRELNITYVRSAMKMVRSIALQRASTTSLSQWGLALLLLGAGWLAIEKNAFESGSQMAMFFLFMAQAFTHFKSFTRSLAQVQESVGASVRLQDLLDEPADVTEVAQPVPLTGLGSGLRFRDMTFTYPGSDEPALSGIDLELRPGETLALVGASGAGKSTLVDLVCRFFDPTEGAIEIDGHPLTEVSLGDWTDLYAMVGQVPFLFHASIDENIRYGRPDATQAEIEAAARAANIHDFITELPQGFATNVQDAGARLSGGQRQRITIARAILKEAPLLLLDEATSALDSESEAAVQEALDRLMKDRTVLVIAHRLATIRNADRIAVLDEGRLVELGTHEELLKADGTYARLHSLQQLAPA